MYGNLNLYYVTSYPNALWIRTSSTCIESKCSHCTRSWNLFRSWIINFLESCFFSQSFLIQHCYLSIHLKWIFNYLWKTSNRFLISFQLLIIETGFVNQCLKGQSTWSPFKTCSSDCPDWFTVAFIALLGFSCYVLFQCGLYFQRFCFCNIAMSIKYRFH